MKERGKDSIDKEGVECSTEMEKLTKASGSKTRGVVTGS